MHLTKNNQPKEVFNMDKANHTNKHLFIDQFEELFIGVGNGQIESGINHFDQVMIAKHTNVLSWQVTNNLHFTVVQSPFQPMQGAQSAEVIMVKDKPDGKQDTICYWFVMDQQGFQKVQEFLYDKLDILCKGPNNTYIFKT